MPLMISCVLHVNFIPHLCECGDPKLLGGPPPAALWPACCARLSASADGDDYPVDRARLGRAARELTRGLSLRLVVWAPATARRQPQRPAAAKRSAVMARPSSGAIGPRQPRPQASLPGPGGAAQKTPPQRPERRFSPSPRRLRYGMRVYPCHALRPVHAVASAVVACQAAGAHCVRAR